jgi:CBS domain-containing protein
MARYIHEVMTDRVITMPANASIIDAGKSMRENDIGDVVVTEGDRFLGLVTDRDIVVRAIAEGKDPSNTRLRDVTTEDVRTLSPDSTVAEAVDIMRSDAIRRIPVLDGARPVGIVSIGDLARLEDQGSALADISEAPPNE